MTGTIYVSAIDTVEGKAYLIRIGVRGDDEIKFELALIPIKYGIDALINGCIFDLAIVGHLTPPLGGIVAVKVVAPSAEFFGADGLTFSCAVEFHPHNRRGGGRVWRFRNV